MTSIKKVVGTIYNYTHLAVGAGAVVVSFLDTHALPPKFAAGVVIASQGLKVLSNWVDVAHTEAPIAEKALEAVSGQIASVVHPAPATPLEPATPPAATV